MSCWVVGLVLAGILVAGYLVIAIPRLRAFMTLEREGFALWRPRAPRPAIIEASADILTRLLGDVRRLQQGRTLRAGEFDVHFFSVGRQADVRLVLFGYDIMLIHRRTELGALDLPIGALIDAIKPGQRDRLNESQLFWEALNSWGVRLDIPPELQDTIIAAFGPASASLSEAVTDDVLTLLARTARAEVGRVHLGPHAVALVLRYPQRYMDRQLAHLREWLKLLRGGAPLFEGAGETERIRTGPEPA